MRRIQMYRLADKLLEQLKKLIRREFNLLGVLGFDELNLSDDLIQNALNPAENVRIRSVPGGPAPEMVEMARDNIKSFLNDEFEKKGI
jgi:argininosuccinate lyase